MKHLLLATGICLLLIGGIPIASALVVSNRLIDDGPDPGDRETMDVWDAWAFRPVFIIPAVSGLLLVAAWSVLWLAERKRSG
jgi:hypothetical protein